MRRVNRNERARLSLTLNGRKTSGEAEPREASPGTRRPRPAARKRGPKEAGGNR